MFLLRIYFWNVNKSGNCRFVYTYLMEINFCGDLCSPMQILPYNVWIYFRGWWNFNNFSWTYFCGCHQSEERQSFAKFAFPANRNLRNARWKLYLSGKICHFIKFIFNRNSTAASDEVFLEENNETSGDNLTVATAGSPPKKPKSSSEVRITCVPSCFDNSRTFILYDTKQSSQS